MYVFLGAGFPMHCDLIWSPMNVQTAAMPTRRDSAARPTYQRTAELATLAEKWSTSWTG
jgi:hypothetical protein